MKKVYPKFKHYLTVAFRNLWKYKTQSVVGILGLAVGFVCFALSVMWIRYEMTYDTFHEDAESLYLVRHESGGNLDVSIRNSRKNLSRKISVENPSEILKSE